MTTISRDTWRGGSRAHHLVLRCRRSSHRICTLLPSAPACRLRTARGIAIATRMSLWWRQPEHFDWFTSYLHLRRMATMTRGGAAHGVRPRAWPMRARRVEKARSPAPIWFALDRIVTEEMVLLNVVDAREERALG